jgi:hypothetical protein
MVNAQAFRPIQVSERREKAVRGEERYRFGYSDFKGNYSFFPFLPLIPKQSLDFTPVKRKAHSVIFFSLFISSSSFREKKRNPLPNVPHR